MVGLVMLGLNQNTIHSYMYGKFISRQEKPSQITDMRAKMWELNITIYKHLMVHIYVFVKYIQQKNIYTYTAKYSFVNVLS